MVTKDGNNEQVVNEAVDVKAEDVKKAIDNKVEDKAESGSGQGPVDTQGKTESLDITEANAILDSLFTDGFYEEEVELVGGRKCVFRTPPSMISKEIKRRMEADGVKTQARYDQLYGLYCLGAALMSVGDSRLAPLDMSSHKKAIASFDARIAHLDSWAGPLVDILITELAKFDDRVRKAYTPAEVKN